MAQKKNNNITKEVKEENLILSEEEKVTEQSEVKELDTELDKVVLDAEEKVNEEQEPENEKTAEDYIAEFSEAAKELDNLITSETKPEELQTRLEQELERAEKAEKEITEQITEQVKGLDEKTKNIVNNLNKNQGFAKFWNGISDGWYN